MIARRKPDVDPDWLPVCDSRIGHLFGVVGMTLGEHGLTIPCEHCGLMVELTVTFTASDYFDEDWNRGRKT